MGKTVPSYRIVLESEIRNWSDCRKALDSRGQEVFDTLMTACRMHASAGRMTVRPVPFEAMLMCMLLEQEKTLTLLEEKLQKLSPSVQT
jgi:hypothetical protein